MRIEKLTDLQRRRAARAHAIRAEWAALTADPQQSRINVLHYLMEKYGISAQSTIYKIIKGGGAK